MLTVTNSAFNSNAATSGGGANGGGIYDVSSGILTVINSTFTKIGTPNGAVFNESFEVVTVPKTVNVKLFKEVPVVKIIKVHGKPVKETMYVKKAVWVKETVMVKKAEMISAYYE